MFREVFAVSTKDDEIQQQTNSQSQAGAASQVIVNLFFATHDLNGSASKWTIKPVVFIKDQQGSPSFSSGPPACGQTDQSVRSNDAAEGETEADIKIKVKGERDSNAQGQGLMVQNLLNLQEIINDACHAVNESSDQPEG